jgi:prepilin-type N-terminal cleavage/methylation domain-containing protein
MESGEFFIYSCFTERRPMNTHPSRPSKPIANSRGFTVIEVIAAMAIVAVLTAVAIAKYSQYGARAGEADARVNLKNLFVACQAFWGDHTSAAPCSLGALAGASYGFNQSAGVVLQVTDPFEQTFGATSKHIKSPSIFSIDPAGNTT